MTNEEAIKWLNSIKIGVHGGDDEFDEKRKQALSIAINAIEAVDYDCANCIWYLKANNSDYPDLEQDERESEETE